MSGTFTIAQIDAPTIGFSTFNPLNKKVARLPDGKIVVGYLYSRDTPPNYNAQGVRVCVLNSDFSLYVTLWDSVKPTNPPSVETTADGQVWIAYNNFTLGKMIVGKWVNIDQPANVAWYEHASGYSGKWSAAWDEDSRCLYVIGNLNTPLVRFEENGSSVAIQIFSGGTDIVEYTGLRYNADGRLDLPWVTIPNAGLITYNSARYIVSQPSINNATFSGGKWAAGTALTPFTPPIAPDSDLSALRVTTDEQKTDNVFMLACLADDKSINFMLRSSPDVAEQAFLHPERAGLIYCRYSRENGARQVLRAPFRGDRITPKWGGGSGGLFARRGSDLYFVTLDRSHLLAFVKHDTEDVWHDFASYSDPAWTPEWLASHTLYALGGDEGFRSDPDIIGTFTIIDQSPADWANLVDQLAPAATYAFRLSLQ